MLPSTSTEVSQFFRFLPAKRGNMWCDSCNFEKCLPSFVVTSDRSCLFSSFRSAFLSTKLTMTPMTTPARFSQLQLCAVHPAVISCASMCGGGHVTMAATQHLQFLGFRLASRQSQIRFTRPSRPSNRLCPQVLASRTLEGICNSGRSVHYETEDTFVFLAPDSEEEFLSKEELLAKLRATLGDWPASELPPDLARFDSLEEAASFLLDSACELDLGSGRGSLQWFSVRLEGQ